MSGDPHKRFPLSLSAIAAAVAATIMIASPALAAPAAPAAPAVPRGVQALSWARTQYGKPYVYGGTGPRGYDCSGLVQQAYRHAGVRLPRTTYQMLASRLLVRVSHPAKGDLAFYGSGHVELYAHGDYTYGAHDSGTRIGWMQFGPWWHPTAYYRVR